MIVVRKAFLLVRLKSIKVVAVDDKADSRDLLKAILERSSAEAAIVGSGQEALAAIKSRDRTLARGDLFIAPADHRFLIVHRLDGRRYGGSERFPVRAQPGLWLNSHYSGPREDVASFPGHRAQQDSLFPI